MVSVWNKIFLQRYKHFVYLYACEMQCKILCGEENVDKALICSQLVYKLEVKGTHMHTQTQSCREHMIITLRSTNNLWGNSVKDGFLLISGEGNVCIFFAFI